MGSSPPAALAAQMKADATAVPEATLEKVRKILRDSRDLVRTISDLEERLKTAKIEQLTMSQKTLPDMFTEVGIDKLGIPAEGNLPAYDAKLQPYYHANIASDWSDENKEKAFAYLEEYEGGEDLIKTVITVALGRGDRRTAKLVEAALNKIKVPFDRELGVPWNTLTAWVKEQVEKHHTTPDLTLLGATVGKVVKLTARKDG